MRWKEFLKPEWRKILITMILGGAVYYLTKLVMENGTSFTFFVNIPNTQLVYPVITLINMFYWYLLSCLIFWVHDKANKIKKHPKSNVFLFLKHNF